ncbi:MAG TPA: hypothetical protein VH186_25290 [Chloroflexia bacterium]|nr:hypothetical protein [Chloroflexia bacterium]
MLTTNSPAPDGPPKTGLTSVPATNRSGKEIASAWKKALYELASRTGKALKRSKWSRLLLLTVAILALVFAPGWFYLLAGYALYRLGTKAGLAIKVSPWKLLRKLLLLLLGIALILLLIKEESSRFTAPDGSPYNSSSSSPAATSPSGTPHQLLLHP